ncbi:HAMP domain-containing protein|uniref:histidine kinase n=1 Tax=Dendrosporobacter quercicolus TaxID=146817 RepID=A0A1G9UXP9_9FIRM|nr:ATP-binding protein [Dendrosporobacter quercicolus]NSL47993.1 HAMP domain-containing protein [Dendrosporobacter quercicolus DSM 1736]SDM64653.1 two-component system, OmpR family, phosphate regulon sensor histidine kinase PhoR [Dendrosporobacter quercicolus]
MIKWSFRTRILISFLILVTVALALLGSYLLWFFYRQNLEWQTAHLVTNAKITEQLLEEYMNGPREKAGIDEKIKELSGKIDLRITILDITGTVLADSWEHPGTMENHLERTEIRAALTGDYGTAIRYSATTGQNMLYAALPIKRGNELIGIVRTASTLAPVEADFSQIRSTLLAAIFAAALLTILLSIRLARKYTAPIEEITAAAKQIADGDLSRRIHIRTGDELELLAHTINQLTSNLDDKINETSAEAKKLSLILTHMDNAVILLDHYGQVTGANKKAREIFNIADAMIGRHSLEVIGNSLLNQTVQAVIAENHTKTIELKTNIQGSQRIFQVFFAPITNSGQPAAGVLSVFHDITALQELHERQIDFVANASHELGTPLTAIRGFAETLLDGALETPELRHKFVSIIHTEAERMNRLLKALLQLAKLDSQEYRRQIQLEPIALQPLLQTVAQELSVQAGLQQQEIIIDPASDAEAVALANYDWLKQVMVNLVENAVKYTPANGKIMLKCQSTAAGVLVEVRDTGIGIPAKDLPFIFDRFYRVDRSRTRTAGGSGLGLALVKFIIEMLGGAIQVESQVNLGTTFTFRLPPAG